MVLQHKHQYSDNQIYAELCFIGGRWHFGGSSDALPSGNGIFTYGNIDGSLGKGDAMLCSPITKTSATIWHHRQLI